VHSNSGPGSCWVRDERSRQAPGRDRLTSTAESQAQTHSPVQVCNYLTLHRSLKTSSVFNSLKTIVYSGNSKDKSMLLLFSSQLDLDTRQGSYQSRPSEAEQCIEKPRGARNKSSRSVGTTGKL